jgi:fatty acid-binding protein DegV
MRVTPTVSGTVNNSAISNGTVTGFSIAMIDSRTVLAQATFTTTGSICTCLGTANLSADL